ncbi:alpha/beta hydrolase [Kangiella sp. HZ709]|uniref:alpha/beta hydrolase n=1 Tax=Kangiella sp. HZ709 TaxID=2666328 RepID=UPI0012B0D3AA|nr:dienelactone hydrolase family protein [Kangiella sp. HZ709]MRX28028.1 carboxylesterase [Kangiella sp. HZ709]
MSESKLLDSVILEPKSEHKATVIWLHGLGADGHDFEPIVPQLQLPESLGIKFIFPHAPIIPVTINNGYPMRAWYDIRNADLAQREDQKGVKQSAGFIMEFIQAELDNGIPADKIILAGFSQGGAVTLHLATRLDFKIAGVIALSTYLTMADHLAEEKADANLATPIFMAHGSQDPVVPMQRAQFSAKTLTDSGFQVLWQDYPMPHAVCPPEITAVSQYIQRQLTD